MLTGCGCLGVPQSAVAVSPLWVSKTGGDPCAPSELGPAESGLSNTTDPAGSCCPSATGNHSAQVLSH